MIRRIKVDTLAELMESENYRDRFVAEYIQTKQRYEKLKHFNTRIEAATRTQHLDNGVDEPLHDCPAGLLREQQAAMGEYLHLLEVRAVIEDIDLEGAIRRLINKSLWAEDQCENAACEYKTAEEIEREKTCCQKDCASPCEEGIYNPPVKLAEVVRCKDCKRFLQMETSPSYDGKCLGYGYLVEANHYCSYGERRNDDKEIQDNIQNSAEV